MELGPQSSQVRNGKQGFVPPFKASTRAVQVPPHSPPMLDDILSQMSQRDFSSTQLFRSNSEYFNNARKNAPSTVADLSSLNKRGSSFQSSFGSQMSQARGDWFLSGSQPTQTHSRYLQPSVLTNEEELEVDYGDEEFIQDSPELFTQRSDFHLSGAPLTTSDQEHMESLEGFTLHDYNSENEENHRSNQAPAPRNNFDTPGQLVIPAFGDQPGRVNTVIGLRSVNEIPNPFRSVFNKFPYFNIVQSKVFDEVMYTDRPLVVCAPTGSGKTVIFELAIIRLLVNSGQGPSKAKVVYMAPMKALCSERFTDWSTKFEPFGLKCKEVTGDSELDDCYELQNVHIIMTTPEKWDSMTRKWRDNRSLVQSVKLFLIDEVHLLNDDARGATVEAVISRMKTVQSTMTRNSTSGNKNSQDRAGMRLIAISATIPNVEDIAAWLGGIDSPASHYSMDDSHRPVKLRKVVLGFPKGNNYSDFRFDLSLNYKLSGIIQTYSDRKPTLVFCSTRKSAQQAAQMLVKDARFIMNSQHRQRLQRIANSLHDSKLRELVICGIGYHHAGLDPTDRRNIETMFIKGDLPVIFATSTLAVGVNLPAHLVIIKSTAHYVMGVFQEYSETQILQMIGRAGRPQFDTSATAVILTTSANKDKYTGLLQGTQKLESSLHHHLIEHLNAEIVLNTITDVSIALEWLKSTFLYIRILKNPTHYGIPEGLEKESLEQKLQDICLKSLNTLEKAGLIKMDDGFDLKPTEAGRLMARYCIAYDSMKQFLQIKGTESLSDMVDLVSKCKEFSDVKLRVNEKRALNLLNKDKNKETIRYPINGRIKTTEQKVNCLIQATLGSLTIAEFSLSQDVTKIFRVGQRITRCLTELQMLNNDFMSLQNSVVLAKCIRARLWENSKFVSRQLEKVGPSLSTMMVNAGLTTFKKIEETNPREIEMIVNRHPPFGSQIREAASNLPKYELSVQQTGRQQPNRAEIVITLTMTNYMKRRDAIGSGRNSHFCLLLIADADNKMVFKQRLGDFVFVKEGYWSKRVDIQRAAVQSPELNIHLISQEYVGLDVSKTFTPHYSGVGPFLIMKREPQANIPKNVKKVASSSETTSGPSSKVGTPRIPCSHRCLNKEIISLIQHTCGHECCKEGVVSKARKRKPEMERDEGPNRLPLKGTSTKDAVRKNAEEKSNMNMFLKNLHQRTQAIPGTPAKRLKMSAPETGETNFVDLTLDERFGYTRKSPFHHDVDSYRVKSEDHVKKKHLGESCWEEIEWHKRQMEEQQDMGEDYTDDDHLADELPCFSVDELWNDDELASILNDDNDTFASPPNPYSWGRGNKVSQSHYYELTAPERCQKKSNVKSQTIKTQMSDEVKRPPSRSSQFLTGSTPKVTKGTSLYVSSSQPKGNPRRILYPLPPPPPTPGADDFEMTSQTWPARRAYSGNWDEELPNPDTTERITQRQKWSSLTLDPLRDMLEKENWGIFPEFTKPCHQRNTSSANQETHNPTNLESPLSATYLDPLAMQEGICLEEESASAIDSHFSTDRCKQSPISSSFFCSKSFKSSEKEHEEQDAFAGIFNGLL
ncbi:putative ATP-dependent DNA helicase HFM1 [Oculina patagonica]